MNSLYYFMRLIAVSMLVGGTYKAVQLMDTSHQFYGLIWLMCIGVGGALNMFLSWMKWSGDEE